jgi:uncharacterized protein
MGRDQSGCKFRQAWHQLYGTARALEDPRKVEVLDERFDYAEERNQNLCMHQGTVLFVVTAMQGENVCRIISARRASRHEQEQYFQGGPLFP